MKTREPASSYCLYCYAPLDQDAGVDRRCPECGRLDQRVDRAIYWTRERKLAKVEEALKVGVIGLLVIACLVLVPKFIGMKASGPGAGWLIVAPLVVVTMLLWQTISLITHRPRYFRARLAWALVFLLIPIGPVLFLFAISLSTSGSVGGLGGFSRVEMLAFLPCAGLSWLAWKSGEWIEQWKRGRIERRGAEG